jgi:hypothetical protein
MMLGVETEGDDIGAIDATAAIVATPSPAPAPAPALAHWPKPTLLPTLGPISLPGRPHLPNITALAEGVHAALSSAVRDAILHAVKVKPVMCPNGKPLVGCIQDSCAAKPCSKSQVCVPTCGSCTTHK